MEEESIYCKFKLSKKFYDKAPAFLVGFSNGRLNPDNTKNIDFTSYYRDVHVSDDSLLSKRILVANTGRLVYKGDSSDENDDRYKLPIRYVVGVHNKITGKMKLVDCIFFQLKPVYKLSVIADKPLEDKTYRERVDSLAINFGNKAKKRAITARNKYSIDASQLPNIVESVNLEAESPTAGSKGASAAIDYIPPQNKSAQCPSEVYNIFDIISEEDDEQLGYLAEKLLEDSPSHIAKWKEDGSYCKYVISHLEGVVDKEKAKYLIYYNYFVIFSRLTYRDIRKKDPIPDIPEPFKSKMLNYFASSSANGRSFPQKMKDKLFAYLFVLALLIDDYSVNISMVLEDIKKGMAAAVTIAQALGCHIVQRTLQDSVVKLAELKIPLFVLTGKYSKRKSY